MIKFNESQRAIIDLNGGWHACQAPAGSGKTEILTERVKRAIEAGQDPESMLCITFTSRAARSMTERVRARMGDDADGVLIGNTHSYALKFLQVNRYLKVSSALIESSTERDLWNFARARVEERLDDLTDEAYQVEFAPYIEQLSDLTGSPTRVTGSNILFAFSQITKSSWDAWNIRSIASLLKTFLDPQIPKQEGLLFEHTKNRLQVIDSNIPKEKLPLVCALALLIQEQYDCEKARLSLYDFDDLLVMTYSKLISGGPHKLTGFTWAQIDEAQDLSPIQWAILRAALAPNAHVLLLGDLGQSIYRFLGASVEVTRHQFGSSIHTLTENYRSPSNLVEAANVFRSQVFKDSLKSVATLPANPNAMILVNRAHENETQDALIRHAVRVTREFADVSVAFLCPSNRGVQDCSESLSNSGIEHFKVGSNDLFTKVEALDFMAFLSVLNNPKNRLAWSRLFWRFGDLSRMSSAERDRYSPLLASAHLAAKLGDLGSELQDFLPHNIENHYLAQFVSHAKNAVTYFDTETTGLDTDQDSIIQLAAIKVDQGCVSDQVDLYCNTDDPLGDSVKVHGITREVLDKRGQPIELQINRFMDFNATRPLIAHNLPFDDHILRSHLRRFLPESYSAYSALPKYCTLDLSRRLYPDLPSYKLGWLLEHFGLEGVNSHNALDDVKAGASLMGLLVKTAESRLTEIAQVVEPYSDALERFRKKFSPLYDQAVSMINEETEVTMKDLLNLYFETASVIPGVKYDKKGLEELRVKLIRHAEKSFNPAPMRDYLSRVVPFYQMAKESDLITDLDRMVVSTIHRSKGLEFDCVLIPNAVEGNLPSFFVTKQLNSDVPELREEAEKLLNEQGRLFYVAFTRAKRQIVVGSYNLQRGYSKSLTRFLSPIKQFFRDA